MFYILFGGIVVLVLAFGLYNLRLFLAEPQNANVLAERVKRLGMSEQRAAERALQNNLPLAATIYMYAIANISSAPAPLERETIVKILQDNMALDENAAANLVDQAYRFSAGPKATPGAWFMTGRVIEEMCADDEKAQLVDMMHQVASADGAEDKAQADLISTLSFLMGVQNP